MTSALVAPQNLLIVDDESAQLRTLTDIFTDEGFEVCACATAEEALERCRDQTFAVVILDLRLGGQDGIELLSRIRQLQPGIRAIIHTAYGSFDSAKHAVNLGAFAYIEKLGDPADLVSQVHRAFKEQFSEALTQSEQRYRDLLNDAVAIVWECDLPSWRLTFVSQHAESILGYPVTKWLDEPTFWVDHIHADDRAWCVEYCSDRIECLEHFDFDYRMTAASGRVVWLHDVVRVVKDKGETPTRLQGVMFDVTQTKLAEQALRKSESRYRSLVESVPICIHEIDLDGRLTSVNPAGLRIANVNSEAALVGKDYLGSVEECDRARIEALMGRAFEGEAATFEVTCRSDDKSMLFSANFIPILGESGTVEKLMGTAEDITDQRAAEASLRESEEKFRAITEESSAIVLIARAERVVYGNPMLAAVTRYTSDELLQMNFLDLVHPEYRELVAKRHCGRLGGELHPNRYEIKIVTKDGEDRWLDLSAQLIEFESRPAVLVTCIDITVRKESEKLLREMQEQLAHVSRLSTMGEMVAGIAHEINQPLSAIANYSLACRNTLQASGCEYDVPIAFWLQQIHEQSARCGDIIRGLRDFVKKGSDDFHLVDLNRIVRDSIALIGSDLLHQSVVIDSRLPTPGPVVFASQVQLQQVLVNLLRNACDATSNAQAPEIEIHVQRQDDLIRITVSDNGTGVEEAQRKKLFDAFYTTKPEGMGMGLAISKSIVEAHGGSLCFESGSSSGSKFHIELPAAQGVQKDDDEEHVACRIN